MDERLAIGSGFWAAFAVIVAACLALDLFGHRGEGAESPRRALAWSALWIVVALAFGGWLWWRLGRDVGEDFFSAYVLEKSLSVDNLFVFLIVFERLAITGRQQRRVLFWGVLGALVLRAVFIGAGAALLARWRFLVYALGALLVFTGAKLALERRDAAHGEPKALAWARRHLPTVADGDHFFARVDGRWRATPLFLALVVIELTDVAFALDSIPAVFAITEEPFVVYTSNVFAVLGLRALFVALAGVLAKATHLRFGLAAILVFAGAKMLASRWVHVPSAASIAVIAVCLGGSIAASAIANRRRRRREARDGAGLVEQRRVSR